MHTEEVEWPPDSVKKLLSEDRYRHSLATFMQLKELTRQGLAGNTIKRSTFTKATRVRGKRRKQFGKNKRK